MKRLFAIPIILLVAILLVVYLILPNYTRYQRISQEVSDNQAELARIQDFSVKMTKTAEDLLEHQENLDKIRTGLPESFSLAPLLDFLQEQAQSSGLILEAVSQESSVAQTRRVQGEEKESRIKEFKIDISVSGFLSSLESFIKSIEKSSRMIEVLSIYSSSIEDEESDTSNFSLLLKVRAYAE